MLNTNPRVLPRQQRDSRTRGHAACVVVLSFWVCLANQVIADDAPDFASLGRPFIEKHCAKCHSGNEPKAELSFDTYHDATSLARSRKVWDNVLRMVGSGEMPPEDEPRPSASEVEQFTQVIRNVFDHATRNAKPNPGRVTMRRLNRNEYRNTISDLIGVDFDPTEDFPSDDIGHGFDNIGDVLSLSPVLMERYLAAAENVMQRAILPDPPVSPQRHLSSRYTEPASEDVGKKLMLGEFRSLSSDALEAIEAGPINTPYQWDVEGEYTFRTRVYGTGDEQHPVRVAILVNGQDVPDSNHDDELESVSGNVLKPAKLLKTFEVKANNPDQAQVLEVRVPAMAGRHRMLVGLLKPQAGDPPVKLYVEYLALEGPLDTRPASQRRLLACAADKSISEQTHEVLARFLRRAYRRPATAEEIQRLAKLVDLYVADGNKWEAGIQLAMQAALCSPKFLFRVELDDRLLEGETQPLDEFQLASRLSYFLWSTMPDDELLDLAQRKELSSKLESQVQRMLSDPKSVALVDNFALQWLQLKRLQWVAPDGTLFASFNDKLRTSMLRETAMFFESVMREDRSILSLLDADYTFLNEPLARHYGIADTKGNGMGQTVSISGGVPIQGDEFRRVSLQSRSRGGLLTQASVLTVTSNPTRTSPVKRGRWVLEQILGAPPPPPPANVPELPEDKTVATGSLRVRMEAHRKNPSCANCHAKMDPIGFALENYDAIGAFRTHDGEFPIDPSGELTDGTKIAGPEELKRIIRERSGAFARCLIEKMMTYGLGRGLEYYDQPSVEKIANQVAEHGYKFSVLITEIVKSDPFRLRRGNQTP